MKKIYFFPSLALMFWFMGCSKFTGVVTPAGEGWKIKEHVHKRITKKFLRKCPEKCNVPDSFKINQGQLDYLNTQYPTAVISIDSMVRYRHADQNPYRHLWGLSRGSEEGEVRHYVTKILKVTMTTGDEDKGGSSKKNGVNSKGSVLGNITVYYYAYKICPPPLSCQH